MPPAAALAARRDDRTRATSWTRCSSELREIDGRHGPDLRPDLRHREAPPPQARHLSRPGQARVHQRGGLRGLRRLLRPVQLHGGRAGGDRIRPQARRSTSRAATRISPASNGFCPSFVTVAWRQAAQDQGARPAEPVGACRDRLLPDDTVAWQPYNILITGIGGTGVITVGAMLGMAAHLDGKHCLVLDKTGLAQKGGAVLSHVRLARSLDRHQHRAISPPAARICCWRVTSWPLSAKRRMKR